MASTASAASRRSPCLDTRTGSTTRGPTPSSAHRGRHRLHHLGRRQHAGLGRVDAQVAGHRRDLGPHQLGRDRLERLDAERVLGRHRGDGRRPPHPVGLERLEVGHHPRPPARVGAGDGEGDRPPGAHRPTAAELVTCDGPSPSRRGRRPTGDVRRLGHRTVGGGAANRCDSGRGRRAAAEASPACSQPTVGQVAVAQAALGRVGGAVPDVEGQAESQLARTSWPPGRGQAQRRPARSPRRRRGRAARARSLTRPTPTATGTFSSTTPTPEASATWRRSDASPSDTSIIAVAPPARAAAPSANRARGRRWADTRSAKNSIACSPLAPARDASCNTIRPAADTPGGR